MLLPAVSGGCTGTAWALGVRDCSVQRGNQTIIEESASPVLSAEQTAELKASAERMAVAVGYCGAATVEFLYHPADQLFTFLEVNTRLQVEHPVTEFTTGFDLVKAQLWVASGGRLEGEPPAERGHAIEARLNAEDPDRGFAPSPGRITRLELPAGPGIRVDTGVSEGDTIPADFDSMIAKIIVYGRDRDEALGRLRRAMAETRVIIEGGATNKSFVLDLLHQPEVIDASADTGWIDRVRGEGGLACHRHSAIALVAAAIEAYEEQERAERQRLLSTASGGRPHLHHESSRPLDLELRGVRYRARPARVGAHRFQVGIQIGDDVRTADVELDRFDRHAGQIVVNGTRYRLLTSRHAQPDAPGRADRIAAMVRSTEPLVRLLGQRLTRGATDNSVMLEVLIRRYYGNKGLTGVGTREVAGDTFVIAERADSRVLSSAMRFEGLGRTLRGLAELAGDRNPLDADIYLTWEKQPGRRRRYGGRYTRSSACTRCRPRSAGSRPSSRAAVAR